MSADARVSQRSNALPRCSVCQATLSPLRARLRTVCEKPACVQRHDALTQRERLAALAQQLQAQLAGTLGPQVGARLPVVWIQSHAAPAEHQPDLASQAQREAHIRYLADLAADPATEAVTPAAPAAQAVTPHHAESHLCAWCGGRCCRHGADMQAYLEAAHLRRWQLQHPGSSLADAAAVYSRRLPSEPVPGSCVYHGAQGCTLDRSMRSDICNHFACDGLRELQQGLRRGDGPEWLFGQLRHHQLQALAHVQASGELQALPLPPDLT